MPENIAYQDIVLNKNITYYHNPFGGIDDEEVLFVLQPKYPIDDWVDILKKEHPVILQFVGKKGRGKTTHLRALYTQSCFSEIFFLDRIQKKIDRTESAVIFIDSVGRISMMQRMKLWLRKDTSYVITTHWNRNTEFWLSGRTSKTYYFEGLNKEDLESAIRHRIALASNMTYEQIQICPKVVEKLIAGFGDDFRGILNFLYDLYTVRSNGIN